MEASVSFNEISGNVTLVETRRVIIYRVTICSCILVADGAMSARTGKSGVKRLAARAGHPAGGMKAERAGRGQSSPDVDEMTAPGNDRATVTRSMHSTRDDERPTACPGLSVVPKAGATDLPGIPARQAVLPGTLSVRAENVLKILALELTGETPPQGRWIPSDLLLQRLTYSHLLTARNCGPQTTAEIVRWAETRGKILRRSFHAGKSLSAMWQDTIAKFSTGEISKMEIAEALENSTRRRNTRIPVALQKILLQLIRAPGE